MKAIIIDLDGTLADCSHRIHLVAKYTTKDFDKFYEKMEEDSPFAWCATLVRLYLEKRYKVVFITGRPERYRGRTQHWLHLKCGLLPEHYELFMRPDEDYRQDDILKKEIYQQKVSGRYDIELAVDDRQRVIDMWRELGITALQCAKGDF